MKQRRRISLFYREQVALLCKRSGAGRGRTRSRQVRGCCEGMANLRKLIIWPAIALVGAGGIGASYYERYQADQQVAVEVSRARDEARRIEREVVQFTKRTLPSGR